MACIEPRASVSRLLAGHRKFLSGRYVKERRLYRRLALEGQRPEVMVIACADSRLSPTTIFDAGPGELFIARNVANIAPPYAPDRAPRSIGAAVEFAVKILGVSDIVVLGHAGCGGVQALVTGGCDLPTSDCLQTWVEIAAPARDRLPPESAPLSAGERSRLAEQAVIRLSVENLLGYPWVRDGVEAGRLAVHGWHFDILDGALTLLDPETDASAATP
jgi:carbonic anhydrase